MIIFPSLFLFSIFSLSIITVKQIMDIYNISFYNKERAKKRNKEIITILYFTLNYNFLFFFLFSPEWKLKNENRIESSKIVKYFLTSELVFYIIHRISHCKYVYKYIHSYHHKNYIVYPMDFLDMDYIEILEYTFTWNFPYYFFQLNLLEYFLIHYFYVTSGFLSHSDILINFHTLHHKHFNCNYCFILPIYDIIFQTFLYKKRI